MFDFLWLILFFPDIFSIGHDGANSRAEGAGGARLFMFFPSSISVEDVCDTRPPSMRFQRSEGSPFPFESSVLVSYVMKVNYYSSTVLGPTEEGW